MLTDCDDWLLPQYTSCCVWADPSEVDSPPQALLPVETTFWMCRLLGSPGSALMWSEAGLWVCCSGVSGGAPVQASFSLACY